jgi:hypothetical protein
VLGADDLGELAERLRESPLRQHGWKRRRHRHLRKLYEGREYTPRPRPYERLEV